MYDVTQGYNKEKLDGLFELAWMIFYQTPDNYTIDRHQKNYEGLQALIMKKIDSEENKGKEIDVIILLKLLDTLYREIIEKGFKKNALEKGLNNNQAKELLYKKIFGEKEKEEIQQQSDERTIREALKTDSKKTVDFSNLFDPTIIETKENGDKNVEYVKTSKSITITCKNGEETINITPAGKLKYVNALGLNTYITKYAVIIYLTENGEMKFLNRTIYSDIDLEKLKQDENYQKTVVEQLLNFENIDRKENEGYVGEMTYQKEDKSKYRIMYSSESYSAIRCYNEQKERKLQEILEEIKGEER